MDVEAMKQLGAALAIGLGTIGPGIAQIHLTRRGGFASHSK